MACCRGHGTLCTPLNISRCVCMCVSVYLLVQDPSFQLQTQLIISHRPCLRCPRPPSCTADPSLPSPLSLFPISSVSSCSIGGGGLGSSFVLVVGLMVWGIVGLMLCLFFAGMRWVAVSEFLCRESENE